MGLPEEDAANAPSVNTEDVSTKFAVSYLESFLPVYQMVNQSAISNVADRYKAIRFAADASLAITASGSSWSAALGKSLGDSCVDEIPTCNSSGESRAFRNSESDATTRAPSYDANGMDDLRETNAWSQGRNVKSLDNVNNQTKYLSSAWNCSSRSRRAGTNARRHQRISKAAHLRAILRKLSMRAKIRRRFHKASWKLSTMRRSKSIAGAQRRLARASRPVAASAEVGRTFENSIGTLQRLIPGGQSMDAMVLLDEVADFMTFLSLQVQALQSVANAVDQRFGAVVTVV